MPRGAHFAAAEEPELLARDIATFSTRCLFDVGARIRSLKSEVRPQVTAGKPRKPTGSIQRMFKLLFVMLSLPRRRHRLRPRRPPIFPPENI